MKIIPSVAVLALIGTLAGCGSAAQSPAAAPASSSPSVAAAPSCHQQYETWKHDPAAKAAGKKLVASLNAVQSAASAEDIPALQAALSKAGPPATKLTGFPMPKCADPKGYWAQILTHVRAAADNAKSSSGLASLMLAEVPLKGVPAIERKLARELKRTGAK
jgi:hypothetical protein